MSLDWNGYIFPFVLQRSMPSIFSSKNQAHLAVKMFVAVVKYLFCPFPRHRLTQCVNQTCFLTTWPPIPKKTIPLFFHLLQKSYYNFNHLPCALPNGMGYGIYELLSSSYFFLIKTLILHPLTLESPKTSWVILVIVCHIILVMLVRSIWYWIN